MVRGSMSRLKVYFCTRVKISKYLMSEEKRGLRILLISFLVIFSFVLPVGTERALFPDQDFLPAHLRIDNSLTDRVLFDNAEKSVELFMKNYDIKGASVAVARAGRLV